MTLNQSPATRKKGNYCYACWGLVHSGPSRADCKCCSAVIHVKCILKNEKDDKGSTLTPMIGSDRTLAEDFHMRNTEDQHDTIIGSSISASMSEISKESVSWMCLDCIEDVESKTHYKLLRHRLRYRESREIFAVIKVQSFTRMVRYRLDFIFAKIGFTKLQQLFRAKKAW